MNTQQQVLDSKVEELNEVRDEMKVCEKHGLRVAWWCLRKYEVQLMREILDLESN